VGADAPLSTPRLFITFITPSPSTSAISRSNCDYATAKGRSTGYAFYFLAYDRLVALSLLAYLTQADKLTSIFTFLSLPTAELRLGTRLRFNCLEIMSHSALCVLASKKGLEIHEMDPSALGLQSKALREKA
jgi:hypothetical protein